VTGTVIAGVVEPQAESVFLKVLSSEVVADAEDASHEATGDFRGGFADFSIKLRRFLDDQNPEVRALALEEKPEGASGKRASQDDNVVVISVRCFGGANHGAILETIPNYARGGFRLSESRVRGGGGGGSVLIGRLKASPPTYGARGRATLILNICQQQGWRAFSRAWIGTVEH